MGLLPKNNAARIAWFTTRTTLWTTNATAIGTTTTQVTDVVTKATAAAAALAAQETAQNAAKAATETLDAAMTALTNSGNIVIEQVRTKARTAGGSVYPLANIPAPATPSPVGPPGTPTDFVAVLNPDGSLKLKWKCTNPENGGGTIYYVQRKLASESAFVSIGATGNRWFLDETLSATGAPVTYQITAQRSTVMGTSAQFLVNFGVVGGAMSASVVSAPRMAA